MNDGTSALADLSPDDPLAQPFEGASPYDDYVRATLLNSLQAPLTESADEMGFLVTTQVMELWFTLIVHEWRAARTAFAKDDLDMAMDALQRSRRAVEALNGSWRPIAALTPAQFNGFRSAFGRASGFQSAMYRHLEFLIGDKSGALLRSHQGEPSVHGSLHEAYHEPSLYDEVLRFLYRRGLPVPETVRERDVTAPYEADPGVVEAWRRVYAGSQHDPLLALGELLTDIAELVARWRFDHMMVVRRAMGSKSGSAGSAGLAWLQARAARPVFPELWTVRGGL
ncbi:tryptophan 2,3-dioxygenase [Streptomyces pluripotens]|uniref:Tryptophan 2,3-dioxygenase n=1 Tax=Streptomyces pluripotens TaxID=1355015 RepID=A0A221P6Y5_9ACTN|nr:MULTISPECIES: tryptophan 2,3-dioxygenase family protein [Streptomyces]ARP73714.1 tryptophan 2,3-dioxygenase [Streptomyces pluripotens]ASN27960.1 tryptophan 2,3-dioxygenase [Streptomyces pluripotens]KIE24326.1 tryptophan 2,3-dioxygenase [Streptomyces sp. MUSC 125]MCH0559425.1 tryptophan 2,3-dioxygenase [Streptomyces sp. MUM 16J]